jgi:hypothetical protein
MGVSPEIGLRGDGRRQLGLGKAHDETVQGMTIMEPDGMRTSIGFHHPRSGDHPLAARRRRLLDRLDEGARISGNDPLIFAQAVADAIDSEAPPLRIVIGDMAKQFIEARRTMPQARFREMVAERAELSPIGR